MSSKRHHALQQVALCVTLVKHQIRHGRQVHWEQPSRSRVFGIPGMTSVTSQMCRAEFDMCRFGLCDPVSQRPIHKRMQVWTTDSLVAASLTGMYCTHVEPHQVLEGQTQVHGKSMSRTQFSESYPRRFARWIAVILKRSCGAEAHVVTSGGPLEPKRPRRPAGTVPSGRRERDPTAITRASDADLKRRRLSHKQTPLFVQCQEILREVSEHVPRVGRVVLPAGEGDLLNQLQRLMPECELVTAVACRGVDRTLGLPSHVGKEDAPMRRSLMVLRHDGEIALEDHWEDWSSLPKTQIIRRNHPCRLCVTVFARRALLLSGAPSQAPEESEQSTDMHAPLPQGSGEASAGRSEIDADSPDQPLAFRSLHSRDRAWLMKAHKNLGHPSNERLHQALREQQVPEALIEAAKVLRCSSCLETQRPKLARPATLKDHLDFNDRVALDELVYTTRTGQQFHIIHIIDYSSSFHVAFWEASSSSQDVIDGLMRHWMSWAGAPGELLVDAARELGSDAFRSFVQGAGIRCTTIAPRAHWQSGKIERRGQILETMLRKYELEHGLNSPSELQQALWHSQERLRRNQNDASDRKSLKRI